MLSEEEIIKQTTNIFNKKILQITSNFIIKTYLVNDDVTKMLGSLVAERYWGCGQWKMDRDCQKGDMECLAHNHFINYNAAIEKKIIELNKPIIYRYVFKPVTLRFSIYEDFIHSLWESDELIFGSDN